MATCKSCGKSYSILNSQHLGKGICNVCAAGDEFECWVFPDSFQMAASELEVIPKRELLQKLTCNAKASLLQGRLLISGPDGDDLAITPETAPRATYKRLGSTSGATLLFAPLAVFAGVAFLQVGGVLMGAAIGGGLGLVHWLIKSGEKSVLCFWQDDGQAYVLGVAADSWSQAYTIVEKAGWSLTKS